MVYLYAQTDVTTGAVNLDSANAAANNAGILDIHAWQGGGSVPVFTIGGSGLTNAVNGTITMSTANGGGTDPDFAYGGVNVWNGVPGSTGGITVSRATAFALSASASRAPFVSLQAYSGKISLPAGTISMNGPTGQGGGFIWLLANEIDFAGTATLSAVDNSSAGTSHLIYLGANTVKFSGGLTINANGKGNATYNGGIDLQPTNAAYLTDTINPSQGSGGQISLVNNGINSTNQPLTYSGGSNALTVTANGDNTFLNISGYPLTITAGTVLVQDQGTTNHKIFAGYAGSFYGASGLVLNGTGGVTFDASGNAGNGGSVQILVDQASITAPTLTLNANGPSSGNGDGGTISYSAQATTLGSSSKGILTANAASAGIGNAQVSPTSPAIQFFPGSSNVTLGVNNGMFSLSAQGGSQSGNAGAINVNPSGNITVDSTGTPVNVSVPGSSGNGGIISLNGSHVTFSGTGTSLNANGSATAGNGGTITLVAGTLSVSKTNFSVNAGSSSGNAGSISTFYAGNSTLSFGALSANATAAGATGGTITFTGSADSDMNLAFYGYVDTSAAGNLAGSFTIVPKNTANDNVTVTIESSGDFYSIISATAKSFDFEATPTVVVGVAGITSTGGDVTINAPGSGTCCAVAARALSPQQAQSGKVEVNGDVDSAGNTNIITPHVEIQPTHGIVGVGSNVNNTVDVQTDLLDLGNASYVSGGAFGNVVNITPLTSAGLTINVPGGGKAGMQQGMSVNITATGSQPVTVNATGSGRANFVMNVASPNQGLNGQIAADSGPITIGSNVDVTGNSNLLLMSKTGSITVNGTLTGASSVDVDSAPAMSGGTGAVTIANSIKTTGNSGTEKVTLRGGGNLTTQSGATITTSDNVSLTSNTGAIAIGDNVSTTGTTGSEVITATAQGNITQTAGTLSTSGSVEVQSTAGNIGSSGTPLQVSAKYLTLNTGSSGGDAYAQQTATTAVTLIDSPGMPVSVNGALSFQTAGALTLDITSNVSAGKSLKLVSDSMTVNSPSVQSSNGSLTLNAVTGPITINGNAPGITSTGGDVIIQLGAIVSNPYPNQPLAQYTGPNLTVTRNGAGNIYWGLRDPIALAAAVLLLRALVTKQPRELITSLSTRKGCQVASCLQAAI